MASSFFFFLVLFGFNTCLLLYFVKDIFLREIL